jgi:hypothetical protein
MGKFKVHLKLQGLELDIEGDRSDMPAINNAVAREITGLIQPAAALTGGTPEPPSQPPVIEGKTGRSARRPRGGSRASGENAGTAFEFRHEPATYGNPLQGWGLTQKGVWLLAVLKGISQVSEANASQLAGTFNEKFKPAGVMRPSNLARSFGKSKMLNPPPIGEDKGNWFLTDEGERQAKELIRSVLAPAS